MFSVTFFKAHDDGVWSFCDAPSSGSVSSAWEQYSEESVADFTVPHFEPWSESVKEWRERANAAAGEHETDYLWQLSVARYISRQLKGEAARWAL